RRSPGFCNSPTQRNSPQKNSQSPCRFDDRSFDQSADTVSKTYLYFSGERNMTRKFLLCGLLLGGVSISAAGDDKHDHPLPAAPTNAGLEKMKTLVGTWVVADKDGKPTDDVVSVIKLTAGGSAVHETLFPGQPHEMISVYTADGSD